MAVVSDGSGGADPAVPAGADPGIDVVVAVQPTTGPIETAVRSVLDGNAEGARLTVVCHNIPEASVRAALPKKLTEKIHFLPIDDERQGAGVAINAGIEAATAEYLCVLRPQDRLLPGALASWFWRGRRTGADVVLGRVRSADDQALARWPLRLRGGPLDPVRDRLCYRDRIEGLISREAVTTWGLRADEKVACGAEVAFATRAWFTCRVLPDRRGPELLTGPPPDLTAVPGVKGQLKFVRRILRSAWFSELDGPQQRSAGAAFTRLYLFASVRRAVAPDRAEDWPGVNQQDAAKAAKGMLHAAPGLAPALTRKERTALSAIRHGATGAEDLRRLLAPGAKDNGAAPGQQPYTGLLR